MLHMFTRSNLDIPEVRHPVYPGSSSGNLIGPIHLESYAERLWQVTEDEKKKFYSSYGVAVGGPTDTAPQESAKRTQFKKAELTRPPAGGDESTLFEPFCYHGMPPDFYRDFFTVWSPRAVIDFTAGDLTAAMTCLELKVPYLGICFTESHVVAGYKHLGELVYEAMLDEKSPLHDAKLSALVQGEKKVEKKAPKRKTTDASDKQNPNQEDGKKGEETGGQADEGDEAAGGDQTEQPQPPKPKKPKGSNATANANAAGSNQTAGGSSLDVLMSQLKNLRKQ